uniref:Uncharacterized protein n=1 Tax=Vibrio harveyi TaxID=669 RepID=E5G5G5_VIBHA|nr:hypothetical protein [Vibrio harveyi]
MPLFWCIKKVSFPRFQLTDIQRHTFLNPRGLLFSWV